MDVGWWALGVSVLSFGVSALTFWRNRTAKPRWELSWDWGGDGIAEVVSSAQRCVARNRGRGDGLDVVLRAVTVDGKPSSAIERRATVGFGEEVSLWFSFENGDDEHFRPGEVVIIAPSGGSRTFWADRAHATVEVALEWSQAPRPWRRLRRRTTYTHR